MRNILSLQDNTTTIMTKMSQGNPGAAKVCAQMIAHGRTIDPENALGAYGGFLTLDGLGVYRDRIWMLYKEVCGENITNTLGVLRAYQLGIITDTVLNHAIDNYGEGLDLIDVVNQVREQLPSFGLVN